MTSTTPTIRSRAPRRLATAALVAGLVASLGPVAPAATATPIPTATVIPDPSFGGGTGAVMTEPTAQEDDAEVVLLQPDGKLVVAGMGVRAGTTFTDVIVARYLPDGRLDPDFSGGIVITRVGANDSAVLDGLLQADGKIVLVGYNDTGVTARDTMLMRYNPDGSLDTTFGGGDGIAFSGRTRRDMGRAVTMIERSGQTNYLVGGFDTVSGSSAADFSVRRFLADGSSDGTFGVGGVVTTRVTTTSGDIEQVDHLLVQTDGRIVAIGQACQVAYPSRCAIAVTRYGANGVLDATFGTGGIVFIPGIRGFAWSGVLQTATDGTQRIVVAGAHDGGVDPDGDPGRDMTLLRLRADGSLDPTFGTGGFVQVAPEVEANESWRNIAVDARGRLVVIGYSGYHKYLGRYSADGVPDTLIGPEGVVDLTLLPGNAVGWGYVRGLAIQPDGRVVMAGTTFDDATPPDDFDDEHDFLQDEFGVARVILPERSVIESVEAGTFTVGAPAAAVVRASGIPTPVLSVEGSLPAGLVLTDNGDGTGTITGVPEPGTAGTYPVTVVAANGAGAPATQAVTLSVERRGQLVIVPLPASGAAGATIALEGAAGSGLPVAYESATPSVCAVSGATLTLRAPGDCVVGASQAGDGTWHPAFGTATIRVVAASASLVAGIGVGRPGAARSVRVPLLTAHVVRVVAPKRLAGATVHLWLRTPTEPWRSWATRVLDANGTATVRTRAASARWYQWRLTGTPGEPSALSGVVSVGIR